MINKSFSIIPKTIFFLCICFIFCVSIIALILVGKKGNENNSYTPPETSQKSKYENHPTVIIDAGHGGEDGGAIGVDGTVEKDLNLSIALELNALLRAEGIPTRLTRSEDILLYDKNSDYQGHKKAQDMAQRLKIAEEYEDAIFISIHMNSFPQEKYKGLQVYYSTNSPSSSILAQKIQTLVANNLQPDNKRSIKPSESGIYLLEHIYHPTVLVECGFLSNREDCSNLNSSSYRSRLCIIMFTAICDYFQNLDT